MSSLLPSTARIESSPRPPRPSSEPPPRRNVSPPARSRRRGSCPIPLSPCLQAWRDVHVLFGLRVEDGHVRDVGHHGVLVPLDLGELAAQPDVGADLLDRSYGP